MLALLQAVAITLWAALTVAEASAQQYAPNPHPSTSGHSTQPLASQKNPSTPKTDADELAVQRAGDCDTNDVLGTARTIGVSGGLSLGLKTYPETLALQDHEVVLTFDDGPLIPTTRQILDALARECVKATFFLVGANAKRFPHLVKQELREGHSLGHHSWSHPTATLRGLSDDQARAEIEIGIQADEAAAASGTHFNFFRFPGFADTPTLMAWLKTKNYSVFGTDIWASDWNTMSAKVELNLLLKRIEEAGRGIILLHDTKKRTADMLPDFLKELKKRGFHVVHIVPTNERTETTPARPGWTSETERILHRVRVPSKRLGTATP